MIIKEIIDELLSKYSGIGDEDDKYETLNKRREIVEKIINIYKKYKEINNNELEIDVELHKKFLKENLCGKNRIKDKNSSLRVWNLYFILHSLELMNTRLSDKKYESIINFLILCQNSDGAFGGAPKLESHLLSTYAAMMIICIVGRYNKFAYSIIDRVKILGFIKLCKNHDGSFNAGYDQESDLRCIYCAIIVCRLLNIYSVDLFCDTASFIRRCQNYDGGFGALPMCESNGGYSFCAYSSLVLLNQEDCIDRLAFLNFIVSLQMDIEGGFSGRINKVVDSCYSYWVGSLIPLIEACFNIYTDYSLNNLLKQQPLILYLLSCCQKLTGGFSKCVGDFADLYHTCYSLSALALIDINSSAPNSTNINDLGLLYNHPIYNISYLSYQSAIQYFYNDNNN